MKDKTTPPPAVQEATQEDFIKAYNELCAKHGYQISASPVWMARDDGTFSLVIKFGVAKYES